METTSNHCLKQANGTSSGIPNGTSAWHHPGPAAFDLRSDTMTTPTLSMLNAIINTTLLDDDSAEDPTTNALQAHIASLTGKEAALLVISGTMANQVSFRAHLGGPPHSVLCDHRSHILIYEAGAVSTLSGAMVIPVKPANGHHLTLADVQAHAVLDDGDIHGCPTRVISLENTLNGLILPQSEVIAIAQFAKQNNIKLHLDGARIWEVAASTNTPLSTLCAPADSVSLCFSKGLSAPIGSMVCGSHAFIKRARHVRKMFGGGTRQSGIISAPARVAVDEAFGLDPSGQTGKLRQSHLRAKEIAALWERKGGKLSNPVETNMVWLDLAAIGLTDNDFVEIATKHGIKSFGGRLVVHYQISDQAVTQLGQAFDETLSLRHEVKAQAGPSRSPTIYGSKHATDVKGI